MNNLLMAFAKDFIHDFSIFTFIVWIAGFLTKIRVIKKISVYMLYTLGSIVFIILPWMLSIHYDNDSWLITYVIHIILITSIAIEHFKTKGLDNG